MINKNEEFFNSKNVTIATFGSGDIAVGGLIDKENKEVLLTLYNLEKPVDIGVDIEDVDRFWGVELDVIFMFDKVESIDIVIDRLSALKERLIELNETKD